MELQPEYLQNHADGWHLENYRVSMGKTKLEIMAASCLAVVPEPEKHNLDLNALDCLYIVKLYFMIMHWNKFPQ